MRESLRKGGTAAQIYANWLEKALEAIEGFFGDKGMADQSLFRHAFGLKKSVPLWTAPAFDRCILLALVYPIVTITFVWAVSGHVGPAETALGVPPYLPAWQRGAFVLSFIASTFCYWRFKRCEGLAKSIGWFFLAAISALGIETAVASASDSTGAVAGSVAMTSAVVGVIARDAVVAAKGAVAGAVVGAIAASFGGAVAGAFAAAIIIALVGMSAGPVDSPKHEANRRARKGLWLASILLVTIIVCIVAEGLLSRTSAGPLAGPLLLFFGLLSALNAPFDWFSLGLTRALLWRGFERQKWWPYLYALVDAALAVVVIMILAIAMVIGVQTFDLMAVIGGGQLVLPLVSLFDGIAANPSAPEYWWVYALLFSTMIPSLINLAIGGCALTRGIPILSTYLFRRMPLSGAVGAHDRWIIAVILIVQGVIGFALGFAAQAILFLLIFVQVLPALGLDMLDVARWVADLDLPARLIHAVFARF